MKNTKNRIIFLLSALLFLSLAALALILFRGHSSSGETSYLVTLSSDQPSVFSIENHGRLKKVPNIGSVTGTITEVYNGSATLDTPDKAAYSVELNPFDTLNKGDRLLVFFTGSVQEIYPSQFENQLGYILLNDL